MAWVVIVRLCALFYLSGELVLPINVLLFLSRFHHFDLGCVVRLIRQILSQVNCWTAFGTK